MILIKIKIVIKWILNTIIKKKEKNKEFLHRQCHFLDVF